MARWFLKQDNFTLEDFQQCGKAALLKRGQHKTILRQVCQVVSQWRNYADESGVAPDQRDKIQQTLRTGGFE